MPEGDYIRWLGHAAFEISLSGTVLLIDPWLSGNPKAAARPDDYSHVDAILVTHMHDDHFGDAARISKKTGAPVVGVYEVALEAEKRGGKGLGMNIGGSVKIGNLDVVMVPAVHTSERGQPAGYIIIGDETTVYHAGDTGLFGDIVLYAKLYPIDCAIVPIGGHYTMDPRQAAFFVSLFKPKLAIPMHFGTFPAIDRSPEEFIRHLKSYAPGVRGVILRPGEKLHV